jgi:hypothetical protein
VLKSSAHWALGGAAVDARVCDSLQAAAGERYFYENLTSMQHQMPRPASRTFLAWADAMTAGVLRGEQLHYLGRPDNPDDIPAAGARFGFTLECYKPDGTLVSSCPLDTRVPHKTPSSFSVMRTSTASCAWHIQPAARSWPPSSRNGPSPSMRHRTNTS